MELKSALKSGTNTEKKKVSFEVAERQRVLEIEKKRKKEIYELQKLLLPGQGDGDSGNRKVSLPLLLHCCLKLKDFEFQDVVEERSLQGLCGFPLCDKIVVKSSGIQPKFKIFTSTREIFETKELNRFCSRDCLKICKGLLNVIPLPEDAVEKLKTQGLDALDTVSKQAPIVEKGRFEDQGCAELPLAKYPLDKLEDLPVPNGLLSGIVPASSVPGVLSTSKATGDISTLNFQLESVKPKEPCNEVFDHNSKYDLFQLSERFSLFDVSSIKKDIESFEFDSFMRLYEAIQRFVDAPVDDRHETVAFDSTETDEFSARRQILRTQMMRAFDSVFSCSVGLKSNFQKQNLLAMLLSSMGSFNVFRPIPSMSMREWRVLSCLLLCSSLKKEGLPTKYVDELSLMSQRPAEPIGSAALTEREFQILLEKLK